MKVFVSDISEFSQEQLERLAGFLSDTEKERLDNMISVKRQREFICGHFLLRKILSQELQKPLNEVEINVLNSGALVLPDSSLGYISLSHSHNQVAIAFCADPVGIDMEWMQQKDNYNAILEQIDAVKDATQLIEEGYSLQEAFFRLWTRREAYYKMSSVCEQSSLDKSFIHYLNQDNFMFCICSIKPQQIQWNFLKSIDKNV